MLSLTAHAQRALPTDGVMRWRPALRADVIIDRDPGAQLGVGLAVPAAYNLRFGVDLGGGGVKRPGQWRATGRADLLARWLTDPFRESRWGLHGGGGVGLRLEERRAARMVAILAVGAEGPSDGRWVPGVELGLGDGVRVGLTLRRAPLRRR